MDDPVCIESHKEKQVSRGDAICLTKQTYCGGREEFPLGTVCLSTIFVDNKETKRNKIMGNGFANMSWRNGFCLTMDTNEFYQPPSNHSIRCKVICWSQICSSSPIAHMIRISKSTLWIFTARSNANAMWEMKILNERTLLSGKYGHRRTDNVLISR